MSSASKLPESCSRETDYDSLAANFDLRYRHFEYRGIQRALKRFLGEQPLRVLEVGCGTGHWVGLLREWGHGVTGLDASVGMLEQARKKLPDVRLLQGDGSVLPVASRAVDRVFCVHALHHLPDMAGFMREAARVLRPGGGLITFDLDPHVPDNRWYVYQYFKPTEEIDRKRYASTKQIRQWMSAAGFERVETFEADRFMGQVDAEQAERAGMLERSYTSQLTVLSEREYQEGRAAIREAMDKAGRSRMMLETDVKDWGTVGWQAGDI